MFTCGNGLLDSSDTAVGGLEVGVDAVAVIGENTIEVGGPVLDASLGGQSFEFLRVAPNQYGIGHDRVITNFDATLITNFGDRSFEMLIGAHAPGNAVHDNTDSIRSTHNSPRQTQRV